MFAEQTGDLLPHRESLSCARAVRDWTTLELDGVFPTFSRHLHDSHSSVSSTVRVRSRAVSSIAPWIPSLLPRLAARSESSRRCSGLLPYQRRSNWYSSSTSTSATTTASFFLWTSIPAILYGISSSGRERRACQRLH